MEDPSRQIDISYSYDFPIEDVFEAWTNPSYLQQWYAPHGCTIEYRKLDIRVGGTFHSCIHNPKFGDCWCIGRYLEIVPQKKIVYSLINADENGNPIDPTQIGMHPDWPAETTVTVSFFEENGKTVVNLKQTAPEWVARKTGAFQSWLQMFERLNVFVKLERV